MSRNAPGASASPNPMHVGGEIIGIVGANGGGNGVGDGSGRPKRDLR